MASTSGADVAKSTFELNNAIETVDADQIYKYDAAEQREINKQRPWRADPHWFKKVRVSATALIKMVMHARSGGAYEVMGLMQGKLDGDTFIVLDSFPLPVQGTETRVNAGNEGNEFAVMYQEGSKAVGRNENVVGWYHSHPGYGCWLSGIDVSTQMTNQMYQDPFLAIVIDPNRTVSAGRVEIGAFRTYPENYTPPNAGESEYQSIPLSKIEDFGVHASRYYNLEISHFKSSLDTKLLNLLWNKYWAMTLSQSPLVSVGIFRAALEKLRDYVMQNRAFVTSQISDLTNKLQKAETSVNARASLAHLSPEVAQAKNGPKGKDKSDGDKTEETNLSKAIKDGDKIDTECRHGLMAQTIKQAIFNFRAAQTPPPASSTGDQTTSMATDAPAAALHST